MLQFEPKCLPNMCLRYKHDANFGIPMAKLIELEHDQRHGNSRNAAKPRRKRDHLNIHFFLRFLVFFLFIQ